MNKKGLLVQAFLMVTVFLKAQTIEDVKKFMYYERWKSASETVDKVLAANPGNLEAVYFKGQIMIRKDEDKDVAGAKKLYQTTLSASSANGNNPLLLAGMGHVELLEGKVTDARNRFETAISLSQGKNLQVLNAVAIAIALAENGDALYGLDKLKQATLAKGFKDAETMTNLGDLYARAMDGGNAEKSYEAALTMNPQYARAKYRTGKIYQRQGQSGLAITRYTEAVTMDPKYSPAYYAMYDIYSKQDLAKAEENLNKYLDNSDSDPRDCYLRAKMKYEQKNFSGAIAKATECVNAGGDVYYKNYGVIAYAHYRMGDNAKAIEAFKKYFEKSKPENIGAGDYNVYAECLMKIGGNEELAGSYFEKAALADTIIKSKPGYLRNMTRYYDSLKQPLNAAIWYKKLLAYIPNPSRTDFFNVAYNYHKAGNFQDAVENWKPYIQKYPNEEAGYYLTAIAEAKIDSNQKMGLAVPNYIKTIEMAEMQWATDSANVKQHYLNACKYLIGYFYNAKKDAKTAVVYCDKYLAKEPGDVEVQNNRKALASLASKPATTPKTGTSAPKTGTAPKTTPAPKQTAKAKTPPAPVKKKS